MDGCGRLLLCITVASLEKELIKKMYLLHNEYFGRQSKYRREITKLIVNRKEVKLNSYSSINLKEFVTS